MAHDFQADIDAVQQIGTVPIILDVACRLTGARFAAVARVTEERWIACTVRDDIPFGLQPGSELPIETTFCNEIRQSGEPVIIDHVAEDEAYCGHPIPAKYGIQSYISVPIFRPGGNFFGTLCALDIKPGRMKVLEVVSTFKLFAELIGFHLDALDRLASTHAALLKEREEAGLRERFVRALAHELRNPLEAINANTLYLLRAVADERVTTVAAEMNVTVRRMSKTLDDLLDFARRHIAAD
jgi:GAF domain-containing protein